MRIVIHTDGGARGNPGPAAIGAVIEQEEENGKRSTVRELSQRIGETTNNIAEYTAVLEALTLLRDYCMRVGILKPTIDLYIDSRLVVNQLNGFFKVKDAGIREYIMRIRVVEQELGGTLRYFLIPRSANVRADFLVNRAFDSGS